MPVNRDTRRAAQSLVVLALVFPLVTILFTSGTPAQAAAVTATRVTHQHFNSFEATASAEHLAESRFKNPSSPICTTATTSAANVNTDCEVISPHNETSIAINPTNPLNLVGSANDYQISYTDGGTSFFTFYSRAHTTFDGGKTWTTYPIDFHGYTHSGDPAVAFDASGKVYLATLGWIASENIGCCVAPDILVSHSSDGGKTWVTPSRVATGTGNSFSAGVFNDKEFIAAWGDGNAIVTWTVFYQGQFGRYVSSPIYASVTHDGGSTWTAGVEISGSASFCTGARGGNACDQNQASVPVVAADGSIYVTFVNFAYPTTTGRDQYLVVKVDAATGQRIGGPYRVADIIDGYTDYPISVDGRPTYQDSEFRTWPVGNIAADPTSSAHLAVIWSDMRNSRLPAERDPYRATTNSDVIVSQSLDGGLSWSSPTALSAPRDQFMPWGAYDATGRLRIGFFDRQYDPANHKYGYTLASETNARSLAFTMSQVTTALSDPTANNRWFSITTVNPAFPHPTTFLGDYSAIATSSSAAIAAYWTDLRETISAGSRTGFAQDAYFGSAR